MLEMLKDHDVAGLSPQQLAPLLAFLCDAHLKGTAVVDTIEDSIELAAQARKDIAELQRQQARCVVLLFHC